MFKKIAIKTGVLTTVFILAVIVSSYVTNRGNTDMSADMGGATLPRISFMTEGYEVNSLPGYKSDMTLTSMRDTLTPVTNNQLDMNIAKYDNQIQKVYWQVYTLNGKKCIQEGNIKDVQDTVTLNFKNTKILKEERILKVTLYLDNQNIYFYTRIKNSADCNYKKSLDFANDFHNAALENQGDKVESYLETDSSEDSSTYQEVTLASTQSQVTWGSLAPQVSGNVYWEIKECNENYTSLVLKYQVKCTGDTDYADRLYSVKEFFRIRTGEDAQQYLLDYDRTMNQRFDGKTTALNQKGVLVGIAPTDLEYETNTDGTIVAFIEDNQLWHYDKKEDEMSLVFGFADAENMDVRTLCDLHDIRLISVDEKGNTTFTVVGYMNRGVHEGQVGVAVYYFDAEKNSVTEKAFVPSEDGYYLMKEDLGKFVYYSNSDENLYVMIDGTLYLVNLKDNTREVLVKDLEEGQYQVSPDGHLLAYQSEGGKINESQKIIVLNLKTGKSFDITSEGDEYVKPIGFIRNDFAYGTLRGSDAGTNISGQSVYPMYKVDIITQKQEIAKTYEVQDFYILDGYVADNMMTLNRVNRNENTYISTTADYITNNQEKEESNITVETYNDDLRGTLVRLTYENGIKDSKAKILKPKQVLFDKPMVVSFDKPKVKNQYYVYALGSLQGVYEKASYAIQEAEKIKGVVISSSQEYVWESGNTPDIYEVNNMDEFRTGEGESTLAACLNRILKLEGAEDINASTELENGKSPAEILTEATGGEGFDLTGCTPEEIQYTISHETPVVAMLSADHAVLVIGYTSEKYAYIDPADGERHSATPEEMAQMVSGSGNVFFGYVK